EIGRDDEACAGGERGLGLFSREDGACAHDHVGLARQLLHHLDRVGHRESDLEQLDSAASDGLGGTEGFRGRAGADRGDQTMLAQSDERSGFPVGFHVWQYRLAMSSASTSRRGRLWLWLIVGAI